MKRRAVLAGSFVAVCYALVFVAALMIDPPWSDKMMAGIIPALVTAPTSFAMIVATRSTGDVTAILVLAAVIQVGIAFLVGAGVGNLIARR